MALDGGVLIPTKPQHDPNEFVQRTQWMEAACPEEGKATHELPEGIIAIKKVLVNGNGAKFKFDKYQRKVTIIDLVAHKGDQLAMLVVARMSVKDKANDKQPQT